MSYQIQNSKQETTVLVLLGR